MIYLVLILLQSNHMVHKLLERTDANIEHAEYAELYGDENTEGVE